MTVAIVLNEQGEKLCSVCKKFKHIDEFGKDIRSKDKKKGTCRPCCAKQRRETVRKRFLRQIDEDAPLIAITKFMKKNPVVYRDFIRRYAHDLQPLIEEVRTELIEDYNKRADATARRYRPMTVVYRSKRRYNR